MKAAIIAIVLLCVLAAANATQFTRSDMQKFSDESVGTAAACIQDIMNCVTAALSIIKAAPQRLTLNAFLTPFFSQRLTHYVFLTTSFSQRLIHNVFLTTSFSHCCPTIFVDTT